MIPMQPPENSMHQIPMSQISHNLHTDEGQNNAKKKANTDIDHISDPFMMFRLKPAASAITPRIITKSKDFIKS